MRANWHATLVESVNFDLKKQLFKAMYFKHTLRWVDLLPFVTESYNSRPKKGLGNLSPKEAKLPKNIDFLKKYLHEKKRDFEQNFSSQKIKFSKGDLVKVVKIKNPFSRGYTQNFDDRTFRISSIHKTFPVTFSLNDSTKSFYAEQLTKVPEKSLHEFYVADKKKIPETFLRNGKILSYKHLTLIKDHLNPNFSEWKTNEQVEKMKKDQLLSDDSILLKPL